MKYFLCRLNPPRPTFPQDITPDEQALMQRHSQYWRGLLGEGKALLFGPVADPAGGWGLGVLALDDTDDVRRYTAEDPVILSRSGFAYDVFPMPAAITRS